MWLCLVVRFYLFSDPLHLVVMFGFSFRKSDNIYCCLYLCSQTHIAQPNFVSFMRNNVVYFLIITMHTLQLHFTVLCEKDLKENLSSNSHFVSCDRFFVTWLPADPQCCFIHFILFFTWKVNDTSDFLKGQFIPKSFFYPHTCCAVYCWVLEISPKLWKTQQQHASFQKSWASYSRLSTCAEGSVHLLR